MRYPEAELAAEHAAQVARGRTLVAGFGEPDLVRALEEAADEVVVFETDYAAFRRVRGAATHVIFAPWMTPALAGSFDAILFRLPKETERLRMLSAVARALAVPGGSVAVCGRNDAGIRSAGRHLGEATGAPADVVAYGRHSRLLRAEVASPSPFRPSEWRARAEATVAGIPLRVVGYPGVFASGRVDPATALLLETVTIGDGARVLDVGCGSGVIAAQIALRSDAKVHAVDADAVAVACARETARANAVDDRVSVWASDVFSDVDEHGYTHILSNPPFHSGVRTTTEVGRRLISEAGSHLGSGGELWIVANRFLDYRTPMEEAFGRCEIAAENGRYRVYRARR